VPQQSPQVSPPAESMGCIAGLVRITWLLFGNVVPFFLAVFIAQRSGFSALDLFFWAAVAGLILLRYVDITRLGGLTGDGEPATLRHWRRYSLRLLLIFAVVWALAHLV
jgi:hypothetical protein